MTLAISPDLALPVQAVTETFAIHAERSAGKSNAVAGKTKTRREGRLQDHDHRRALFEVYPTSRGSSASLDLVSNGLTTDRRASEIQRVRG